MGTMRRKRGSKVDGWLILDKPVDLTSTQAVNIVKRIFDAQKAGHAGTLDPLATGILPIALGEATKTVPYAMDASKAYRFTLRFGEARSTDDAEGAVVQTSDVRPGDEAIRAILPQFTGLITQVPPAFSAIKVEGQRAYDLARAGEQVELEPRQVMIRSIRLTGPAEPGRGDLRGDLRQGRLHARPGPGFGNRIRDLRPYPGPAADRRRAVHGTKGDFAGISEGPGA